MLEYYRKRVAGTNIDPRSLLSNDYLNLFNSVVMLFGMLPDAPELLDEIDDWKFITYTEHFTNSGLDFGPLAVEAYPFAPVSLREQFEGLAEQIREFIEESRKKLRELLKAGEIAKFNETARQDEMELRRMIDNASAIVHGHDASLDQGAIDKLF